MIPMYNSLALDALRVEHERRLAELTRRRGRPVGTGRPWGRRAR
ncbi:hypothetical protein [Nocardioides aequoreus]|nr:hypothetical protein [Nocardioides aequoreus]